MNEIFRQTKTVSVSDKSLTTDSFVIFLQPRGNAKSEDNSVKPLWSRCCPAQLSTNGVAVTIVICHWKGNHSRRHNDGVTMQTIWLIQQVGFHENVAKSIAIWFHLPGFIHKHTKPRCFLLARRRYWCTPARLVSLSLLSAVFLAAVE